MSRVLTLIAAALLSITVATSASAHSFMDDYPDVYQAMHPERDLLNGGALTPAGRMGLELPYGAAPVFTGPHAYPAFGSTPAPFHARHRR